MNESVFGQRPLAFSVLGFQGSRRMGWVGGAIEDLFPSVLLVFDIPIMA
jgi:hypothetical protein